MIKKPTARNMDVYNYIVEYMTRCQYSPAIREISEGVGFKSASSVLWHLTALKEAALIDYEPAQSRTITLVGYELVKMN